MKGSSRSQCILIGIVFFFFVSLGNDATTLGNVDFALEKALPRSFPQRRSRIAVHYGLQCSHTS